MNQKTIDFTETLCQMEGAHIFYLTEQTELYISNAVSYIVDGVQKGERVLFVENSRLYPKIEKKLKQLLTAEEMELLLYINNFDFYWRKGNFRPEAILEYFEKIVGSFTADGRHCRTWGHIEWGSHEVIEERILNYESEINSSIPKAQVISVCAYDSFRVSDELRQRLMNCHGYIMNDNSITALAVYDEKMAQN